MQLGRLDHDAHRRDLPFGPTTHHEPVAVVGPPASRQLGAGATLMALDNRQHLLTVVGRGGLHGVLEPFRWHERGTDDRVLNKVQQVRRRSPSGGTTDLHERSTRRPASELAREAGIAQLERRRDHLVDHGTELQAVGRHRGEGQIAQHAPRHSTLRIIASVVGQDGGEQRLGHPTKHRRTLGGLSSIGRQSVEDHVHELLDDLGRRTGPDVQVRPARQRLADQLQRKRMSTPEPQRAGDHRLRKRAPPEQQRCVGLAERTQQLLRDQRAPPGSRPPGMVGWVAPGGHCAHRGGQRGQKVVSQPAVDDSEVLVAVDRQ